MVLQAPESEPANTGLNGHSAKKMNCCVYCDAANPHVIENKNCESTDHLKADSAVV